FIVFGSLDIHVWCLTFVRFYEQRTLSVSIAQFRIHSYHICAVRRVYAYRCAHILRSSRRSVSEANRENSLHFERIRLFTSVVEPLLVLTLTHRTHFLHVVCAVPLKCT
ncbi:hypothetical protein Tcan_00953, partial [Toxocara canis]